MIIEIMVIILIINLVSRKYWRERIICKYLFLEIFWWLKISEGKIGESNQLCAVSSVHMKYHIRKDWLCIFVFFCNCICHIIVFVFPFSIVGTSLKNQFHDFMWNNNWCCLYHYKIATFHFLLLDDCCWVDVASWRINGLY